MTGKSEWLRCCASLCGAVQPSDEAHSPCSRGACVSSGLLWLLVVGTVCTRSGRPFWHRSLGLPQSHGTPAHGPFVTVRSKAYHPVPCLPPAQGGISFREAGARRGQSIPPSTCRLELAVSFVSSPGDSCLLRQLISRMSTSCQGARTAKCLMQRPCAFVDARNRNSSHGTLCSGAGSNSLQDRLT